MKTSLKITALVLLVSNYLFAQSPNGFNYQAVIRNPFGEVLADQSVSIQMRLLQGSDAGSVVYSETFTRDTNSFGLVSLVVGSGVADVGDFESINWTNGPYFLQTAIDISGGSDYQILGASQLMSVPFAMYAQSAANDGQDGASAYEIWLAAGNTGSQEDFLASLVGSGGGVQDISLSGTELSISDGSTLDLSGIDTNTQLTENEVDNFVSDNGYLTSFTETDGDPANEIQTISRADDYVVLSNSGGMALINDADADPINEIQTLSINENEISLSDGGGAITLPVHPDPSPINELNTSVVLNGTDLETTDAGGMITTDLSSLVDDADADPTNEINATVILNGTNLETTDAGGTITTDLSSLVDDADADVTNEIQEISTDATPGHIAISDGSSLVLNVDDADADPTNEIQDLQLIDNTLRLTNHVNATSIAIGMHAYGDVKNSFKNADHDGWFLLDGRAISSLPEVAQANANAFFSGNLPDATNRFLKSNNGFETNGDIGGSTLIGQDNLPSYTMSGSTDASGAHNHGGYTQDESNDGEANQGAHQHTYSDVFRARSQVDVDPGGINPTVVQNDNTSTTATRATNSGTGSHFHAIATSSNHSHIVTTNSGGSDQPYYQPYLVTNVYIYLGGTSLSDLQALGNNTQEILDAGISPYSLWDDDSGVLVALVDLVNPTTPITNYNNAGVVEPVTLQVLVDQGVSLVDLFDTYGTDLLSFTSVTTVTLFSVVDIETMNTNGVSLADMLSDGIGYSDLIASVFTHQDLKDAGVSVANFIAAGYGVLEIDGNTDFTLNDLRVGGYSVPQLLGVGYTFQELKDDGVSVSEFISASVSIVDLLLNTDFVLTDYTGAGVVIADLYGAFPLQDLKSEFSASDLLTVSSVQELLDDTDITVQELYGGGAIATDFHGISFEGGLIFHTQSDGTTYVAQANDQSAGIFWGPDGDGISTGQDFGTGSANTDNILASLPGPNAASVCRDLGPEWFLPSRNEIREMYDNILTAGGFQTATDYWMSTDDGNNTRAGSFSFADRSNSQADRSTLLYVRAIKSLVSAP